MASRQTIVVGVNGTESARRAAEWAAQLAESRHADLVIVCSVNIKEALNSGAYVPMTSYFEELRERAGTELTTVRDHILASHPDLTVTNRLRDGNPVESLLDEGRDALMVVLGSRKDDRSGQLFPTNSVAVNLVAHGRVPVAVIRQGDTDRPLPTTGPVVVGIDGSPASEKAIEIAFEEASRRRTELVAVNSWSEYTSHNESLYASYFVYDWEAVQNQEKEVLAERVAGWREKYPDVPVRRVILRTRPETALISQGANAQLLVVGSRGRGGFTGMILGSTSRRLINNAPCPLIVARPDAP
jgi:nucleotide-binding universal stress UspA family protein